MKRTLSAGAALAIYVAGALVGPWVHQRHHAIHGEDHAHTAGGGVASSGGHTHAPGDSSHAAMDEALAMLELAEVASAGVPLVDCELAAYTLVDCSEATPAHAVAFGDDVQTSRAPVDLEHGKNSLEHLGAQLLASAPTIALTPPSIEQLRHLPPPLVSVRTRSQPAQACRGPPLRLV